MSRSTSRLRRTPSVVWAATSGGRIFITTNAGASDPATIAWQRVDPTSSVDPPRYPSDIYVDPSDPNHAYITYSGYNHVTPDTPGHIFEVRYNRATGTVTFTRLDGSGPHALGDLPISSIERDERKGVLYAGSDFGVVQRQNANTGWSGGHAGPAHDQRSAPEDRPAERRHVRDDARLRRLDAQAVVVRGANESTEGPPAACGRPLNVRVLGLEYRGLEYRGGYHRGRYSQ